MLGIPSIYTPHGYSFQSTDIPFLARIFYRWAEQALSLIGDHIVAVGETEAKIAETMARAKHRVHLIHNAVNCDALECLARSTMSVAAAAGGADSGIVHVGTMGRTSPQHDAALFAELACALGVGTQPAAPRTGNGGTAICMTWIGVERWRHSIPGIDFVGWLDKEEALRRLAGLDVYVNISRWDGLSLATLEAMAMGKPVVATDIPAAREIVRHGETGFLCKDAREMVEAVRRLADAPALRRSMGDAGQRLVRERHDISLAGVKYASLYRDVAGSRDRDGRRGP
jgi:glycosyltransferase involved in cell wall biosynthesis